MSWRYTVAAFLLLLIPICLHAEDLNYTILLAGNKAGFEKVHKEGDTLKVSFEYNDRGRGPKLDATVTLNSSGLPVKMDIQGNDYFKGAVQEHFSWANGIASWENKAEKGEKQQSSPAYYTSFSSFSHEIGLLAKALIVAPQNTLPLLPEGQVRIERIGDRTISDSSGKQIKVVHWAMYGLEFIPTQVWLEESGTYFASAGNWFSVVREGWESSVPELAKVGDEFQALQSRKLAESLAKKASAPYVFRGGNVFDSEQGVLHKDWTVVVSANRIAQVGPASEVKIPEGATVIDVKGKTLMPGLYDMHVHISDSDGPLHLAAGITSVRDMANDTDKLLKLKKDYETLAALGPRITMAGFIDSPGPYQGPSKVLVSTEKEARDAVDRYAELGYVQVKIYSSLKPELVPIIIEEAHKKGLRVSGHIPATMTAEQLVRMGQDEIQHANFLVLNFLKDVTETRTPARFTSVAERGADLDLKSQEVRDFITLLRDKKTVLDPTINVFESLFTDRPGVIPTAFATVANRLPSLVRRGLLAGGLPVPEGKDQQYRSSWKAMESLIKAMYDAGVTIVPGTDSLSGFGLHRELELYVESGIPPAKVLQIATMAPAKVLNQDKDLGSIAAGKLADLVVVDGDPTQNISDIRKVRTVMKDGILLQAADLYSAMGIKP